MNDIRTCLPGDHPWQNHIYRFEAVDSTNDRAKAMAAEGAPEGTCVISASQTGGRGRLGRSFHSPANQGLYLSLVLRPNCPPQELMHLTCAAAVAACDAVEHTAHIRPRIKWTNDLVSGGKKLGGILTELSLNAQTGLVSYAVVGIGINCTQTPEDFPPELQSTAASLSMVSGSAPSPEALAAALLCSLHNMNSRLLTKKAALMAAYRQDCMTVGKQVVLLRGDEKRRGTALDVTEDGALTVQFEDGTVENVSSGEISVRGMYGYV